MRPALSSLGHSAQVRIELRLNGSIIPVCKVGPDRLSLTHPQTIDYDHGEVIMYMAPAQLTRRS